MPQWFLIQLRSPGFGGSDVVRDAGSRAGGVGCGTGHEEAGARWAGREEVRSVLVQPMCLFENDFLVDFLGELSRQCLINEAPYGFLVAHMRHCLYNSHKYSLPKGVFEKVYPDRLYALL